MASRTEVIRERVAIAIQGHRLGPTELQAELGLKRNQIYKYTGKENTPSLELAPTMARVLGVSLSYLAGAEEDEPEERAIELMRDLSPEDKMAAVANMETFVAGLRAGRQVAVPSSSRRGPTTTRTPGEELVSATGPSAGPSMVPTPIAPKRKPPHRSRLRA